jgi:hypothetical protein
VLGFTPTLGQVRVATGRMDIRGENALKIKKKKER